MVNSQDTKFSYKIIFAALCTVLLAVLIAFYYSYAQSQNQIDFLHHEKELLVEDLKLMKADVDRLKALDQVNDIELQSSRYRVQELLDSVGKLNFTIDKLREYKTELRRLELKNDSLKIKNDFLNYNNTQLTEKYDAAQQEIMRIKAANEALVKAEALKRDQIQDLNIALRKKKYLTLQLVEGSGFRERSGKRIQTNKASTIKKLKGCVIIDADEDLAGQNKQIYFQFLGPNMGVIADNANTINVNGNTYSKRVQVDYRGEQIEVCDFISVPEGSLESGLYTLNVFENERLLSSSEFTLK